MVPSTVQGVFVLLLAIAPGYIALLSRARARTWAGFKGDLDTVLRCLAVSLLIQIPMFPLAVLLGLYPHLDQLNRHAAAVTIWLLLAVLGVPIVGGLLFSYLSTRLLPPFYGSASTSRTINAIREIAVSKEPSPWGQQFFSVNVPDGSFLVVEFEDGKRVAGTWEAGSYSYTSPDPQGLFLAKEWVLDDEGYLDQVLPGTQGVLIHNASTTRKISVLTSGE